MRLKSEFRARINSLERLADYTSLPQVTKNKKEEEAKEGKEKEEEVKERRGKEEDAKERKEKEEEAKEIKFCTGSSTSPSSSATFQLARSVSSPQTNIIYPPFFMVDK